MSVGATVGDLVMFLKGDKYPFSCCAINDSILIAIPMQVMRDYMQANSDFYYRIVKHVLLR